MGLQTTTICITYWVSLFTFELGRENPGIPLMNSYSTQTTPPHNYSLYIASFVEGDNPSFLSSLGINF
jgi:hypothetical protein